MCIGDVNKGKFCPIKKKWIFPDDPQENEDDLKKPPPIIKQIK
jgi:hypothetical protein